MRAITVMVMIINLVVLVLNGWMITRNQKTLQQMQRITQAHVSTVYMELDDKPIDVLVAPPGGYARFTVYDDKAVIHLYSRDYVN